MEEQVCQLRHWGMESEKEEGDTIDPLLKIMEYEDQRCLELFLREVKRQRGVEGQ